MRAKEAIRQGRLSPSPSLPGEDTSSIGKERGAEYNLPLPARRLERQHRRKKRDAHTDRGPPENWIDAAA